MRRRYQNLIGNHYSRDIVYIQSDKEDRVLMSASCNAYGLFPAQDHQVWNSATDWQPIPIHELPPDKKDLLEPPYQTCAKLRNLYDEYLVSDEIKSELETVTKLREYLEFHSGTSFKSPLEKLHGFYRIYDTLNIESSSELT